VGTRVGSLVGPNGEQWLGFPLDLLVCSCMGHWSHETDAAVYAAVATPGGGGGGGDVTGAPAFPKPLQMDFIDAL
jgi:hypothetical protein